MQKQFPCYSFLFPMSPAEKTTKRQIHLGFKRSFLAKGLGQVLRPTSFLAGKDYKRGLCYFSLIRRPVIKSPLPLTSSCYAQQVMCSENARRSGLNKRCITLATINCRAFAREVVFWTILKVFEFIVYCLQCSSYIFSDILLQMKQTVNIVHLA